MADESPALKQGDIEDLLRQAQMASGLTPDSSTLPDAAVPPAALPPEVAAGIDPTSNDSTTATMNSPRATFAPPPSAGQNIGDDVQFLLAKHSRQSSRSSSPWNRPWQVLRLSS